MMFQTEDMQKIKVYYFLLRQKLKPKANQTFMLFNRNKPRRMIFKNVLLNYAYGAHPNFVLF